MDALVRSFQFTSLAQSVFIIAEIGVNHNGDLQLARQLIDVAVAAGADAVKFQSFQAKQLVSAIAPKADYQLQTTDPQQSQLAMLQALELSAADHQVLQQYCQTRGICFLSTPFDVASVDLLDQLQVPCFKIASGEVTNWGLLRYIAQKGKPVLLSTGMADLGEVDAAVQVLQAAGCQQLALLHCVSNYPAAPEDVNLRAIQTLKTAFQLPVGYSDHTPGITVALAAAAMGACIIEKHVTLDKTLPGPDHQASLTPEELTALVQGIRQVEQALGDGRKQPRPAEANTRLVARRSLATIDAIPAGTELRADLLTALRPASGISPSLIDQVVGRRSRRPLPAGHLLDWGDLE